jgi:hypothetical protein
VISEPHDPLNGAIESADGCLLLRHPAQERADLVVGCLREIQIPEADRLERLAPSCKGTRLYEPLIRFEKR